MFRVIIIDDEFYFRSALKANMPWAQNDMALVGDASDGETGLRLILEEKPDAAIVDINMPGLSGLELIRRAQDAGVECQYVILTGYDEFKYAQQAVSLGVSDYVLKPVDFSELTRILVRLRDRHKKEHLNRDAMDGIRRQAQKLQLDRSFIDLVNMQVTPAEAAPLEQMFRGYRHYRVALFAPVGVSGAQEADALRDRMMAAGLRARFRVFIDSRNRLAMVTDAQAGEEMNALTAEMSRLLEDGRGRPDVGVGRAYEQFEQVSLSYNEACIALKNRLIYSEFSGVSQKGAPFPITTEARSRLKNAMLSGNAAEVKAILREIYQDMYERYANYDIIVLNTLELVSFLMSILSQNKVGTGAVLNNERGILDTLERFQSVWAFYDWTERMYQEGIARLQAARNGIGNISRRVLEYVQEHLGSGSLSVNQIAERLFLNYGYICVTFKKDMGMTINEYILRERMEKARGLFEQGNANIALVAREVGYEDPNYFSKCFRKHEGVSPSEFLSSLGNR